MTCDDVRERLTAYLDGDVDADRGTLVRGHLRGCEACRRLASDEAALRDELRALPPLDPPSTLWAGVQARLAAAEVAEARRPAWRRVLSRWTPALPRLSSMVAGGLVATAAVTALWLRVHRSGADHDEPVTEPRPVVSLPSPDLRPVTGPDRIAAAPAGCDLAGSSQSDDVTADLATDASRLTACYAKTADELLALARDARAQWSDDQRTTFDAKVSALRDLAARAEDGKPRQRAFRAIVSYVRGALVRDEIALASGGTP